MIVEDSYTIVSWISLTLVIINIPFGFIRYRKKRFSRAWGRCIYIPVLISYIFRKLAHLSYSATPFFLFATLLGQIVGSIASSKSLERYQKMREPTEVRIQESE